MSEQEEQRLAISYGWLVQVVNRHTCGTGPGGHYGAHEPGCGTIPICPLSEIEGIAAHDREVKAAALREMADDWMYPDRISRLFQDWLRETATSIESEARP